MSTRNGISKCDGLILCLYFVPTDPPFPLTFSQLFHPQLTHSDVSFIKTLQVLQLLFRLYEIDTEMLPVCT